MADGDLVRPVPGTAVTGTVGLIDAAIVRFLGAVREHRGPLWSFPTEAAFAPAVPLEELRYVLDRLRIVDRVVLRESEIPPGLRAVSFPLHLPEQTRQALRAPVADDDTPPESWTIDALLRDRPNPLVLLSGCFDLIHAGHVHLIEAAARYGAEPVVAALSTRGIRVQPKNQEGNRPFWTMADRVTILRALRSRPRVLLFDGPDCLELITRLRPDVWIKEARDRGRPIVAKEAELAARCGARVVWIDDGFRQSSTAIARHLLSESR